MSYGATKSAQSYYLMALVAPWGSQLLPQTERNERQRERTGQDRLTAIAQPPPSVWCPVEAGRKRCYDHLPPDSGTPIAYRG